MFKIKCRKCEQVDFYFYKGLCESCSSKSDKLNIDFCGIYKVINLINNKLYIGQSKQIYKRLEDHYYNLSNNRHRNKHLQNSWNKHGEENFLFEILEVCDIENLDTIEKHYISLYNSMNRDFGYNNESGGNKGKTKSLESRLKISISRMGKYSGKDHPMYGKPRTEATKYKLKLALTGRHHTEETKQKMSKAKKGENHPFFGKKLSEEHCKNMSIANKGRIVSKETIAKLKITHKGKKFTILTDEQEKRRIENRIYEQGECHPLATFSNEQIKEMKEMLIKENGNVIKIAKELDINKNTLYGIKNLHSWVNIYPEYNEQLILLQTKKRCNFTNEQIYEIRNRYKNKEKMKDLSKEYKCSEETIRRIVNYIGYYEKELKKVIN